MFAAVPNGWEPQPLPPPYRVTLGGTATAHDFDASDSGRAEVCLPRFRQSFEVDSLDVAAQMMQAARQTVGGVTMDTWVKLSLRAGRAFFARAETVPRQTVDPNARGWH